jgi:hypothetical protein
LGRESVEKMAEYQRGAKLRLGVLSDCLARYPEFQQEQAWLNKRFRSLPVPVMFSNSTDLSGQWAPDERILGALDDVNESCGVAWILRTMMKGILTNLEIRQTSETLMIRTDRKLLGGGFYAFQLDGRMYPCKAMDPMPGYAAHVTASSALAVDGEVRVVLRHGEWRECEQVMRRVSHDKMEVRVTLRERSPGKDGAARWQDVFTVDGYAHSFVGSEV